VAQPDSCNINEKDAETEEVLEKWYKYEKSEQALLPIA
jgi:hypothetical protein